MRLSSYAYTLDKMNYYIHLTNNAVQSSCAEYGALMKGNIFPVSELEEYARAAGKRPEQPSFMAQIRETIRKAFDATHDILNPNLREHCFELFGFDFMVDEAFKVWMLECNSGPSLSESPSTSSSRRQTASATSSLASLRSRCCSTRATRTSGTGCTGTSSA